MDTLNFAHDNKFKRRHVSKCDASALNNIQVVITKIYTVADSLIKDNETREQALTIDRFLFNFGKYNLHRQMGSGK